MCYYVLGKGKPEDWDIVSDGIVLLRDIKERKKGRRTEFIDDIKNRDSYEGLKRDAQNEGKMLV